MELRLSSFLSRLCRASAGIYLIRLFLISLGAFLVLLPSTNIQAEYTSKDYNREKAIQSYLEKVKPQGPYTVRDREKVPVTKTGTTRISLPATATKGAPSVIEKAYRLQYSQYILKQLAEIEHIEIPSSWLTNQRETIKTLDQLSIKARDRLKQDESEQLSAPGQTQSSKLKEKLKTIETIDEPSVRLRERLINLKKRYLNLIEKYFVQFGYELFRPESFLPSKNMVVSPDYILGPGDKLRVNIWGSDVDIQFDGTIHPDGTITLPRLGVIPLAGVRYGDAKKLITKEAEKYIQGIHLNLTVIEPRSLEIYVVGQVKKPGLTIVPAFATVLTALNNAGGPLKVGSLRNIMVYRKGKLYRRLDLYDIILKGDITNDVLLEDRDVVHVPYIGPTVAVVGAVRRPAIFEMKNKSTSLNEVLALAGRAMSQAQAKLNIRRFKNNQALSVVDVTLGDPSAAKVHVKDGDLVEVRYIAQKFPKTIKISGHVWDPFELTYHEGMKISDVIPRPEMLKPEAITDYALLRRYNPRTTEFKEEKISLPDIWSGKTDFPLKAHDEIRILSKMEFGIQNFVYLRGAVWRPGQFRYKPGITPRDLIALGGGLKKLTGSKFVELTRQKVVNNKVETKHFRFDLSGKEMDEPLQPFDIVNIPQVKDAGKIYEVSITGEVRFPGTYSLKKGERLSDLIRRAGGFLPTAYLYGAQYYSKSAQVIQQRAFNKLISELQLRISSATVGNAATALEASAAQISPVQQGVLSTYISELKKIRLPGRVAIKLVDLESLEGSAYDFELKDEDKLIIPSKPAFVSVVGSVYSPNSYLYKPEATLADYLKLAGGPSKTADEKYLSLHKANGEIIGLPSMSSRRFYKMKLMPGDTIVVPENLERIPHLRLVKDITDIIYKITLAVGVTASILL